VLKHRKEKLALYMQHCLGTVRECRDYVLCFGNKETWKKETGITYVFREQRDLEEGDWDYVRVLESRDHDLMSLHC
jgi:hypothetical protein